MMVAGVEQRRAPPSSNQPRRFHIQPRHHIQTGRRRVIHRRRTVHIIRQITLTVLLRVTARLRTTLLPIPIVRLHVLRQMIRTHESLVADRTRESLFAGVGPQVPLEFIGTGEAFAAEEPVADEGSFAGVPTEMGFQVGGFAVDLAAAGDVTTVDVLLAEVDTGGTEAFRLLAVGTVAGRSACVPEEKRNKSGYQP